MQSSISLNELTIRYDHHTVIDGLSLDIPEGEFLVLLGPSGCGKSTLLNTIAGFNPVSSGRLSISGKDVTDAEPKNRGIGMVFQSYALYPHMSVRRNLSFGLRVAGHPKPEIEELTAKTAKLLHLEPLLDRKPAQLSGGQRQRVAIGRALMRNVDVFLFDEPLSNLDAKLRNELRVEIKKLHQALGNTMVYVTHDQVEAMTLADRIAIMRDGVIQQLGRPSEVYNRPSNLFVAGFIGSPAINRLEGKIQSDQNGAVFNSGELTLALHAYDFTESPASGPATLCIRPEHLTVCDKAALSEDDPVLHGTISVAEPMGPETILWFDWQDQSLSIKALGEAELAPDTAVAVRLDPSKVSLFGADGKRL